jgi:DNA-binding MarR family transcriptional regulator
MSATTITDDTGAERRARLSDAPPSAKLVHWELERNGPATQGQLSDRTLLSQRTVRSALDALEDAGLVEKEIYVPDARKKVYHAEPIRTA